jgi:fructokinase
VIVVGGEALVDLVQVNGELHALAGGGPFNTAIALGRLGVPVCFLGAVSRDGHGGMLAAKMAEAGVDTSLVRWSDAETATALVKEQSDGTSDYVFDLVGRSFADLTAAQLPALPDEAWALHIGTLALALDPPAAAYEALAEREFGRRRIILDPNIRPAIFGEVEAYRRRFERLAALADVIKLSEDDARWLYPGSDARGVLELLLRFGPRVVALTRGSHGAIAATTEGVVDVPGLEVAVADTVGAGDSFGAAFIAALIDENAIGSGANGRPSRQTLRRAVSYAVTASAITCTRRGAVPPTRAEIAAFLGR